MVQTFERFAVTLKLTFSNGETIETTREHPFFVEHKGFLPADELGIGTSIVTRAGPAVKLVASSVGKAQKVFNFEVEDFHTYFVGSSEAWVHNQCAAARTLTSNRTFTRGDKTFSIDQGAPLNRDAADGWEHIWHRHCDPTDYTNRTKFPSNFTQEDILSALNQTIKHGEQGDFYGKTMFLCRMNVKGSGYRYYRATCLPNGRVESFHPMEPDWSRTQDWARYNPWGG